MGRHEFVKIETRFELSQEAREQVEALRARPGFPEIVAEVSRRIAENMDADLNVVLRYGTRGSVLTAPDQLPWLFRLGPCTTDSQRAENRRYYTVGLPHFMA